MWNNYFFILSGFLLTFYTGIEPNLAIQVDQQFPLGTIGCLFSKDVCETDEPCIDDLLFGTCGQEGVPRTFTYTLTEHDLGKLYAEIGKLVQRGFTWTDGYTQCILQNVIISLSIRQPFSKKICYNLIFDFNGKVENEISSVLDELLNRATIDNVGNLLDSETRAEYPLLAPSQKRDEIVRVHKYFDKNKKIHKRRFWSEQADEDDTNYLPYYPSRNEDGLEYDPRSIDPRFYGNNINDENYSNYGNIQLGNNDWQDNSDPYEDLLLVKSFLEETARQQDYRSKLSQLFDLGPDGYGEEESLPVLDSYQGPVAYGGLSPDDLQPGYIIDENGDIYGITQPGLENEEDSDDAALLHDLDLATNEDDAERDDNMSLPPAFANTLDKLIKGEMEAENLTDEELNYLTPYVTKMLLHLNTASKQLDDQELEESPGDSDAWAEEAMEADMILGDERQPFGIDEEDMLTAGSDMTSDDDDDNLTNEPSVDLMQKKSNIEDPVSQSGDVSTQKADVVDTNIAFITMDQPMDEDKAEKLIEKLESILKTPEGTLRDYILESPGTKLKIHVDPVLAGVNASTIARLASEHRSDLEAVTGLKFKTSGLGGKDNEVEYQGDGDQYFVLTFVLCGCIAGILLAVVVIYLIRRNSRSKEKLQQITAAQEGNDAASKDYQDLCRQRMQSKSSEKPEPLHTAASRVGSVSESQVRSPSSRSSTSSWSEEPVNSNMDISTGHIVLSYMEDHLKNKDRLEREWEAMCAYEADPCSTSVAEDSSNVRKNRYSDVLPYDHSRVVLTSATNVSGSDYVNASTITDHDPRNPAYVATQGPLPHTVADFWQMVWEQGSVVIVMLTKLTEGGEGKCHRYWPEEGSDLYHIYEVHLVSEHIWCEDYLVRSFYLKNLQTGETRTVTQFHFLTWQDLGIPASIKALLDFRRKVNKSYRGRSCPIMVHCSDGCGRTGTYCLIDMVLNRMAKGAKEIDIAATLEHIRDQRMNMVKTKEQFQFALAAVAEEVHAILKALPQ